MQKRTVCDSAHNAPQMIELAFLKSFIMQYLCFKTHPSDAKIMQCGRPGCNARFPSQAKLDRHAKLHEQAAASDGLSPIHSFLVPARILWTARA